MCGSTLGRGSLSFSSVDLLVVCDWSQVNAHLFSQSFLRRLLRLTAFFILRRCLFAHGRLLVRLGLVLAFWFGDDLGRFRVRLLRAFGDLDDWYLRLLKWIADE